MRVGVVGLGKLGLPVALTLEQAGHELYGWDTNPERRRHISFREVPEAPHEPHLAEYLNASRMTLASGLSRARPEIVLVCVQTPHQPQFEGVTPLEQPPQDFDYSWLRAAVGEMASEIRATPDWDPLLVIVSTCLPGTFDRELRALCDGVRVAYHPLFIAMGSVIEDFREPEFLLFGVDDAHPGLIPRPFAELYGPVTGIGDVGAPPVCCMSIRSAELTKVAYNAWLGYKLMLSNGIAETCDKVGADCDDVIGALRCADRRLISTAYMTPGMGDGGGCHPRDQIALSWLASEIGLSHDPYGLVIAAREAHARWLAAIWIREAARCGLPMVMLGRAYKRNSALQTGSHARLLEHYVRAVGYEPRVWDTREDHRRDVPDGTAAPAACYFLATPHDWILASRLEGVLIDPWGIFPDSPELEVIRPGRRA